MILGNFNDEPELKKIQEEFEKAVERFESRKDFLEKQLKDFNDDTEKHQLSYWAKVEKYFEEQKRFPTWYSDNKYAIQREDDGCFILIKKSSVDDRAFEEFLESLSRAPKGKLHVHTKRREKKKDDGGGDETKS